MPTSTVVNFTAGSKGSESALNVVPLCQVGSRVRLAAGIADVGAAASQRNVGVAGIDIVALLRAVVRADLDKAAAQAVATKR
jgi:hypothetical protein